jgi:hypothetical protein
MARDVKIQKSVNGQPLPDFISSMKGVQAVIRERAFELEAESKVLLIQRDAWGALNGASSEGKAQIRKRRTNRFAWTVYLFDPIDLTRNGIDRGSAAINIEDGRRPYVARTRMKTRRGTRFPGEVFGGMTGLHIIRNAVAIVAARHRSEFR